MAQNLSLDAEQIEHRKPVGLTPKGGANRRGLLLVAVSCAALLLWVYLAANTSYLLPLVVAPAVLGGGLLIFFLRPRFWVSVMLMLSVATVALPIYQIPIVAGQTLQLLRITLLVAVFCWAVSYPTIRARVPQFVLYQVLFMGWAMVSLVFLSDDRAGALDWIIGLAFGLILILWLPQVVHDEKSVRILNRGIYLAGLIFIGFGIYQYVAWFTGIGRSGYAFHVPFSEILMGESLIVRVIGEGSLFRVTLPFTSPSHLAPGLSALLLITLPQQLLPGKHGRFRFGLLFYHLALFGLLLTTYSRGAWLGFAFGVLALFLADRRLWLNKRVWIAGIVVLLIAVLAFVLIPDIQNNLLSRLDTENTSNSDAGHLAFRLMALDLWLQYPIAGIGLANFFAWTGIIHAHSIYVTVLAELGVIGLGLLFMWLAVALLTAVKSVNMTAYGTFLRAFTSGLFASFFSLLANNLFQQSFYSAYTWLVMAAIGAVFFVIRNDGRTEPVAPSALSNG